GPRPFGAGGVVTAVGREASGATVVDVDARRSLDDPWPSLARVIWLALALLLLAVHAPLAVLRLRAAAARKRGLAEYARRPAAARSAFF
ncbi:intracellular growth attenuator igaA, partial [Achromobacter ruhlandii]|nr:intracellular growth attenuator igaA [Achromobacter ruhlandii]